jgi:hypothetical protein
MKSEAVYSSAECVDCRAMSRGVSMDNEPHSNPCECVQFKTIFL